MLFIVFIRHPAKAGEEAVFFVACVYNDVCNFVRNFVCNFVFV